MRLHTSQKKEKSKKEKSKTKNKKEVAYDIRHTRGVYPPSFLAGILFYPYAFGILTVCFLMVAFGSLPCGLALRVPLATYDILQEFTLSEFTLSLVEWAEVTYEPRTTNYSTVHRTPHGGHLTVELKMLRIFSIFHLISR